MVAHEESLERISLHISIVSVLERFHMAKALKEKINLPNTDIVCDVTRSGSWHGTKLAWKTLKPTDTHLLVMEEDAGICNNFYQTVLKIIEARPDHIISLFDTRGFKHINMWAEKNDSHWATLSAGASGVAVLMPAQKVLEFLKFEASMISAEIPYEDTRLWAFMKWYGYKTWVTVPNIVEHNAPMQSSLGFNSAGKISYDFIGEDKDGLNIDWTLGIEKAENHPFNNDNNFN